MPQQSEQPQTGKTGKPSKPSKYRNEKVVTAAGKFDSKKEAARFEQLAVLERDGSISGLSRQCRIRCEVNGQKICDYVADFTYLSSDGASIVEDVKSEFTRKNPVYRLKKKLVKAIHGIDILEK